MINIAGVILCGGKSTRMGEDKKYLKLNDKTFLEIAIDNLKFLGKNNIILSGSVKESSYKTVEDEIESIGPIGGIKAALKENYSYILVLPVDCPKITESLLKELIMKVDETHEVFKYSGQTFPFILKNSEKVKSIIKENIKNKVFALKHLFNVLKCLDVEYKGSLEVFENINYKEDYIKLQNVNR